MEKRRKYWESLSALEYLNSMFKILENKKFHSRQLRIINKPHPPAGIQRQLERRAETVNHRESV